jgi:hypothetical protein
MMMNIIRGMHTLRNKGILVRSFVLILFLLHKTAVSSFSEPSPGMKHPVVGEKLTYILRWGLIPVGWATLHVKGIEKHQGRKVYVIAMTAWSNTFLSKIYKVKDYAETYVDVETQCSLRFYKNQYEGGYQSNEEMVYDQEKHHAKYHSFRNGMVKEMEIPANVQDALSSIYYFRTLPMEKGKSVFMDVNADEKNWVLEVQVLDLKKDWEVRRMGSFDAFYIEPLAKFKGMFERRGRVWVWVSADHRRLPLLVKSKVPFGSVTGTLVKAEIVIPNSKKKSSS